MSMFNLQDLWKKLPHPVALGVLATAGVTLALFLSLATRYAAESVQSVPMAPIPAPATVTSVVARHLTWAEEQTAAGLDPQLLLVREFFANARARTRTYASEVLGWDSKLALAGDYLTGGHNHEQFMQDRFAAILFSEADLEAVVQQVVAAYLGYVNDVESQMLVSLEADLADLSPGDLPTPIDREALTAALHAALSTATTAAQGDFQGMVGRELVSWVASEVLTMAAAQLATSAGILGAGGASGWATFGAGLVIGLIVDAVVTEIYNQHFDPVDELSSQLEATLSQMETLILQGTNESAGLQGRLHDYSARLNFIRRQAIQQAVLTPVTF